MARWPGRARTVEARTQRALTLAAARRAPETCLGSAGQGLAGGSSPGRAGVGGSQTRAEVVGVPAARAVERRQKVVREVHSAPERHCDTVIEAWLTGRRRLVARRGDGATAVGSASAHASSRLWPPAREGRMRGGDSADEMHKEGRCEVLTGKERREAVRLGQGTTRD
jgi:hypothetical protein